MKLTAGTGRRRLASIHGFRVIAQRPAHWKGKQLLQSVQRGVEEIRILEIGLVTRLLVLNWLKPRREGLVPFCCERSHVTENALHLVDANVPREWDCIQTRPANSRIGEQRVEVVSRLSPPLRQKFVFHHWHHQASVADLLLRHSFYGSSDDACRREGP